MKLIYCFSCIQHYPVNTQFSDTYLPFFIYGIDAGHIRQELVESRMVTVETDDMKTRVALIRDSIDISVEVQQKLYHGSLPPSAGCMKWSISLQ